MKLRHPRQTLLSAALFAGLWPAPCVVAQTSQQKAAIKHLAEAAVLAGLCPYLEINTDRMLLIMVAFKLSDGDAKDGPIARAMRAARQKAELDAKGFAGNSTAACVAALSMFGPTGGNVENLLTAKK